MHDADRHPEQHVAQDASSHGGHHAHEDRGHHGQPESEGLARADGAEEAEAHGVEDGDGDVQPREQALEQHAHERGEHGDGDEPVVRQRHRGLIEQQVAEHSAAGSRHEADDADPQQVEAAVFELRREHGALHTAEARGGEVEPERGDELLGDHAP